MYYYVEVIKTCAPWFFYISSANIDYKNPLHLDVEDPYLRRMVDWTIPDEASPRQESFCPTWIAGIDLPQSKYCGFLASFIYKKHIST